MPTIERFTDIALADLLNVANEKHSGGWRAVQVLACNTEEGIDLTDTFNKDNVWENYRIKGITKQDTVPSLQQMYLCLFPFENEVVDLFGVNIAGMALDFGGRLYDVAVNEPMTIISPEVKAARDKAKKAAQAAAAKAAQPAAEELPKPLTDEEIEAKVAAVSPEKQDKVRAALKAKQKKDQEALAEAQAKAAQAEKPAVPVPMTDEEIEAKVAAVAPEKQDKVRAALKAKQKKDIAAAQAGKDGE